MITMQSATFDDIGQALTKLVKPRPRGPEERSDSFAFFKEIDAEQMRHYTPDQIKIILQQRENVKAVVKRDMAKRQAAADLKRARAIQEGTVDDYFENTWQEIEQKKPWITRVEDQCTHTICPACRPSSIDRVYISLDGVADGHVPATAAAGYGFHIFGQRPVYDAHLVANLPRANEVSNESGLQSVVETLTNVTSAPRMPPLPIRPTP